MKTRRLEPPRSEACASADFLTLLIFSFLLVFHIFILLRDYLRDYCAIIYVIIQIMFKPQYHISNHLLNQLSEISEIRALVSRSRLLPEREIFLKRSALIKMAHTSTSIEGNNLKEFQVAQLAEGKRVNAPEDQIREVKNYLSALKTIDRLSNAKKTFNIKDLLAVHRQVVDGLIGKEKSGSFRKWPVFVVNVLPDEREEVAYTPPVAEIVPVLMQDLLDWLGRHQEIHPIIKAGLFHYQFETIHPFTDGNGRCGRLLTLLYLYQSGWDFKKVLILEDYYNRDRKSYYLALQTGKTYRGRENVDLTSWVNYFVTGFLDEARRVKDQILSLLVLGNLSTTRNVLDKDELKIVDFVINLGRITSTDVVEILSVPKRTAQAKLKKLEEIKVLVKKGAGPSTYYTVSQSV